MYETRTYLVCTPGTRAIPGSWFVRFSHNKWNMSHRKHHFKGVFVAEPERRSLRWKRRCLAENDFWMIGISNPLRPCSIHLGTNYLELVQYLFQFWMAYPIIIGPSFLLLPYTFRACSVHGNVQQLYVALLGFLPELFCRWGNLKLFKWGTHKQIAVDLYRSIHPDSPMWANPETALLASSSR